MHLMYFPCLVVFPFAWTVPSYTYHETQETYEDALPICWSEGGTLVSIHSQLENDYLYGLGLEENNWIGLRDRNFDGNFEWEDDSPLDFVFFDPGTNNGSECVRLSGAADWRQDRCNNTRGFVCQIELWRHEEKATYLDAEALCESEDGTLLSIHSENDQSFVFAFGGAQSWIGLADFDHDGVFQWEDGSVLDFEFWDPGSDTNDCARFSGNGDWRLSGCNGTRSFACQRAHYNYVAYSDAMNYTSSLDACTTIGGGIAQPKTAFANAASATAISGLEILVDESSGSRWYIGVYSAANTDHTSVTGTGWSYADGTAVNDTGYTSWDISASQPDEISASEACAQYVIDTDSFGLWHDNNCTEPIGRICQYFKTHDYWFHTEDDRTYPEALKVCQSEGGTLVTIHSKIENDYLMSNGGEFTWIGLTDMDGDTAFDWEDGSPLDFEFWDPGMSENQCARFSGSGDWRQSPCDNLRGFICQADTTIRIASTPAPTPVPSQPPDVTEQPVVTAPAESPIDEEEKEEVLEEVEEDEEEEHAADESDLGPTFLYFAVILMSIAIIIYVIALHTARKLQRDTDVAPIRILVTAVAVIDWFADGIFTWERFQQPNPNLPNLQYAALFFLLFPLILNFSLLCLFLKQEFTTKNVKDWFTDNSFIVTSVCLLSFTNLDVLLLLTSEIFAHDAFNAPFSSRGIDKLRWLGLMGNFTEDFPQLVIQLIVLLGGNPSIVTIIATAISAFAIFFGVTRRVLFCLIFSSNEKERQESIDMDKGRSQQGSRGDGSRGDGSSVSV